MQGYVITGISVVGGGGAGLVDGVFKDLSAASPKYDSSSDPGLPLAARRRMSRLIAMTVRATRSALSNGSDGGGHPFAGTLIHASANGEINTIGSIIEALTDVEPRISPTAFSNSVHNAAPGYWSILAKNTSATTTLSLGDVSFEAGMFEAWTRLNAAEHDVVVTAGDEAIDRVPWADPGHATVDLCGALRIESIQGPGLGMLRDVRHSLIKSVGSATTWVGQLVEEFQPDIVVQDFGGLGDSGMPFLADGVVNPCSMIVPTVRFIAKGVTVPGGASGKVLLLAKIGRFGDGYAIVIERNNENC